MESLAFKLEGVQAEEACIRRDQSGVIQADWQHDRSFFHKDAKALIARRLCHGLIMLCEVLCSKGLLMLSCLDKSSGRQMVTETPLSII